MTVVTFRTAGARITGFDLQGHSGYADEGADIVCAAITSAVRLLECTVNDVLGLAASVRLKDEAALSFRLPGGLDDTAETASQALLTGLMVYFSRLQEEYPDNLRVQEAL